MAYLQNRFAAVSETPVSELEAALRSMEADETMNTPATYTANGVLHPDHLQSFTEKHLLYIKQYPKMNAEQYLANLRLKIRSR